MPGLFPMDSERQERSGKPFYSMCGSKYPANKHKMSLLQDVLPKYEEFEIPLGEHMPKEKYHPTKPIGRPKTRDECSRY